jgi:hypothetical protein
MRDVVLCKPREKTFLHEQEREVQVKKPEVAQVI